jgi:hypothetical protein
VFIIDESGKRIPYDAEFDHFWHRADATFEGTWLVCKPCNSKLRNKRRGGFWQSKICMFVAYHEAIEVTPQLLLPGFATSSRQSIACGN